MNKVKAFLQKKSIGFWLNIAGFVFALVGLVLFFITMQLQENMYASIVAITIIGLVAALVVCYKDFFRLVSILCAFTYLLAGCLFLVSQLENIGYAITGVNIGDGIMPSFVAGMIMYGVATVAAVATIFVKQTNETPALAEGQ